MTNISHHLVEVGQLWSKLTKLGPKRSKFGRTQPKVGRPNSAELGPRLAEFGHQIWSNPASFGRSSPTLVKAGPSLDTFGPDLVAAAPISTKTTNTWPNSVKKQVGFDRIWSKLANLGQSRPNVGHKGKTRPRPEREVGRKYEAAFDPIQPRLGRISGVACVEDPGSNVS